MDYIIEVAQKNQYVFIALGLAIVGSIAYGVIRLKILKSSNAAFLAQRPDAAKIYLAVKALITSEAVTVYTVDGERPQSFMEAGKTGLYVIPGKRTVEMSYSHSRPGVLHRAVTHTYGPVTKELETEPGKSYLLGFDRDAENFTFAEM